MFSGASLIPTAFPKPQFRAVILCGYGQDLYPLIEAQHEISDEDPPSPNLNASTAAAQPAPGHHHGQTKALLPVAGRRMVDWVLDGVEQAGVFDALVLSPASIAGPMATHLRARRLNPSSSTNANDPTSRVELEEVPEPIARKGTVAVIKHAAEQGWIKTDFLLLPCDLLLSPSSGIPSQGAMSIAAVLDKHRSDDNLLTALFSERLAGNVVAAKKDGPGEILTTFDKKTGTLLDMREMDDFDEEDFPLRTSLLAKFPHPTLSTSLLPTHLYVFSSLVLSFLTSPDCARRVAHLETVRELAAYIARRQWRHRGAQSLVPVKTSREDGLALGRSTTEKPFTPTEPEDASRPETGANTPALGRTPGIGSRADDREWNWEGKKSVGRAGSGGCKILIWRESDGWAGRGNTVAGWVELNRAALKLATPVVAPAVIAQKVYINDSYLHSSVYANLAEGVGLKKATIGKNSFVGKGSKIVNSVLMEGVVVGDKVTLENCVVSNGVQIREGCTLKDCQIGRHVIVEAGTSAKGEQMVTEG